MMWFGMLQRSCMGKIQVIGYFGCAGFMTGYFEQAYPVKDDVIIGKTRFIGVE